MDGLTHSSDELAYDMPAPAPLAFAEQNLRAAIEKETTLVAPSPWFWRALVFGSTLIGTVVLLRMLHNFFGGGHLNGPEIILLAIVGLTFAWIILSVASIAAAIVRRAFRSKLQDASETRTGMLRTALLIPIYNESPADVFGNAAAMLADLHKQRPEHPFTLFILSDTRDPDIAVQEWNAFEWLRRTAPADIKVHYRRRAENTDKKTGNLAQWIRTWGADYEAMLVLDADSLMSGRAIRQLADALRDDPTVGLIQSFPGLIGAETLFGRVQQFSNATYGWLLAEGLALWTKDEGNYWGHNAIVRTRAFASSAGLPRLKSWNGHAQMILSHDFVEAGLLRRAGWAVRFMAVHGSFEETPATLVDYVLRDRRWCKGNLQHLRLLGTSGFHPLSRFHLFFGAMSYLMSPAWMLLVIIWAVVGLTEMVPERYFTDTNPLYPLWPEMSTSQAAAFLLFMFGMLLLPKLAAGAMIASAPLVRRRYGGWWTLWGSVLFELIVSILYAPIMMVQQCLSVLRAMLGRSTAWTPQRRSAVTIPLLQLLRFHVVETVLGVVLVTGLLGGFISLWLLPIAVSLILAVPLSALSAVDISRLQIRMARLETPQNRFAPAIWLHAQQARAEVRAHLAQQAVMPAE